jgi:hypothetical protein
MISRRLGLSLADIEVELSTLRHDQGPTAADWRSIGARMRAALAAKIAMRQRTLNDCIGCLWLERCAFYNRTTGRARRPRASFFVREHSVGFRE